MKIFRAASAVIFLSAAVHADVEPPLPIWEGKQRAEELSSGWLPGAILLTDDPLPGETERTIAGSLGIVPPTTEEAAGDNALFPEVPEKFLNDYFAERPKGFLVDPQGLLSPNDYRDRLGFLNYHASDSSIDLFVYLLDSSQEIPSDVRDEEMTERLFNESRPAAVIFYYLGAPQRSVIYLSPSLTGFIPVAEQSKALESSIMQAVERTNPSEQFEKFLVQMSIRIYWMERMLSSTVDVHPPASPAAAELHKVSKAAGSEKFHWLQEAAHRVAIPVSLLIALVFAALGFNCWLRKRARYRFPEFEVEPRLGGAHAAGVGAVISFASASVPPASQRDQVPEYLRRM